MDRLRRWCLLTLASLVTAAMAPPRKTAMARLTFVSQQNMTLTVSTEGTKAGNGGAKLASWRVTWGDGTETSGLGAPPLTLSHPYAAASAYLVTLSVTDS